MTPSAFIAGIVMGLLGVLPLVIPLVRMARRGTGPSNGNIGAQCMIGVMASFAILTLGIGAASRLWPDSLVGCSSIAVAELLVISTVCVLKTRRFLP